MTYDPIEYEPTKDMAERVQDYIDIALTADPLAVLFIAPSTPTTKENTK